MSWGTPIGSDAHKEEVKQLEPPKGTGDVKVWDDNVHRNVKIRRRDGTWKHFLLKLDIGQVEFERFVRQRRKEIMSFASATVSAAVSTAIHDANALVGSVRWTEDKTKIKTQNGWQKVHQIHHQEPPLLTNEKMFELQRMYAEKLRHDHARAFNREPPAEPKPIITRTKRQFDFSK